MSKTYAVVSRSSKAKETVEFVEAESAEAASAKVMASSVTVEGMGGKYVTVVEVVKVERVS